MNRKGFMEYEIELKLLTDKRAGEAIETSLLPLLDANVTNQTLVLTNHYFDSPDRILRQHDIGLRIRGYNHKFEQTLKTSGKSIGGLHQRPEYNVQLESLKNHNVDIPDLGLFPLSAWPKNIDVDALQLNIETLFTTHFERNLYLLEFPNGDIVEMVWDLGEVQSGHNSVPICEIELELKKGATSALFDIAKRIVSLMPTSIGVDSKAARGYRLLDGTPNKRLQKFQQAPQKSMPITAQEFASGLATLLQDFQMLSAEISCLYSQELATLIKRVLFELVDNVTQFKHHFPCQGLDSVLIELEILSIDWSAVTQQNHKNDFYRLLTRTQTTQLQLDIVQCLVEQPWSPMG